VPQRRSKPIRDVDLQRDGARANLLSSSITTLEVARSHQHGQALYDELSCDLETDPLIGSGDQSNAIDSWALITAAHSSGLTYAGRVRWVATPLRRQRSRRYAAGRGCPRPQSSPSGRPIYDCSRTWHIR